MNKAAVILGNGFSCAAGFPLEQNLFDTNGQIPRYQSESAKYNHNQVAVAYDRWKQLNPNSHSEAWLLELYLGREDLLQELRQGTTWDNAIRFALSRLVNLPKGSNAHYYYGICTPEIHPFHKLFWEKVEKEFRARDIVTLNYDILIEQALHDCESSHRSAPKCYYGGFQYVQTVRMMTDITKRKYEIIELGKEFVLYKLHGSINWAWEPHSRTLKIHQDVRAVFRCNNEFGTPAIIPPIPEKEMPARFSQIWTEASKALQESNIWIVCGYSLPKYDYALQEYFAQIIKKRGKTTVLLLDPKSDQLAERWQSIGPNLITTVPLPGLPDALNLQWKSYI